VPNVDVEARTEYKRLSDASSAPIAASAVGGGSGGGRGAIWAIKLHAYGTTDNLRVDLSSDPQLTQEDIILLLTIGMTRAELDQLAASSVGASVALSLIGNTAAGTVKNAIPIIDDFKFGSAYNPNTYKTEPQLTIGKRLAESVRASIATTLGADPAILSTLELQVSPQVSIQSNYQPATGLAQSGFGNLGLDLRWRLNFE